MALKNSWLRPYWLLWSLYVARKHGGTSSIKAIKADAYSATVMTSHVHDLSSLSLDDKNFWKSCKTLERKSLQSIELFLVSFLHTPLGMKPSKSYATPWGWTFAIWKLFAFFIYVSSKNKRRYSKKCTKNKCVCFDEVIWLITTKMRLKKKKISHKYDINRPTTMFIIFRGILIDE